MSDKTNTNGAEIVTGMLGIAFVVLKLCGVIDWSWWWVTAPFWGGLALALIILFGGFAWILLTNLFSRRRK